MKTFIELLLSLCFIASIANGQEIKVKWALAEESSDLYKEVMANMDYTSAWGATSAANETLYRYFCIDKEYFERTKQVFEERWKLWEDYSASIEEHNRSQEGFNRFIEQKDRSMASRLRRTTPKIHFEFIGPSKECALVEIEIQTLRFDEFRGDGFADQKSWNDIVLKHKEGTYSYEVKDKMSFIGGGETTLRFWSDNYYESVGLTPMGCYMIDIKFKFKVDGKNVSVSTGPFKIDA